MRGACNHARALAAQCLGTDVGEREILRRDEAAGRPVIGRGEIDLRSAAGVGGDGRDRGVRGAGFDRAENRVEPARLDRAGDLQLLADGAREIDVEAGQRAVGPGEGEGRIFVVGDEADGAQPARDRAAPAGAADPRSSARPRRRTLSARSRGVKRSSAHRTIAAAIRMARSTAPTILLELRKLKLKYPMSVAYRVVSTRAWASFPRFQSISRRSRRMHGGALDASERAHGDTRQRRGAAPLPVSLACLHQMGLPPDRLLAAARIGAALGVAPEQVMLREGWISERAYYRALARWLGLTFVDEPFTPGAGAHYPQSIVAGIAPRDDGAWICAPEGRRIETLAFFRRRPSPIRVHLTTPSNLRQSIERASAPQAADVASGDLHRRDRQACARSRISGPQFICAAILFAIILAALAGSGGVNLAASALIGTLIAASIALRLLATFESSSRAREPSAAAAGRSAAGLHRHRRAASRGRRRRQARRGARRARLSAREARHQVRDRRGRPGDARGARAARPAAAIPDRHRARTGSRARSRAR